MGEFQIISIEICIAECPGCVTYK